MKKVKQFKKMTIVSYVDPELVLDDKDINNKAKLTAFSLCGDFPIELDPVLIDEEEITDDILREIVKDVHATTSRAASLNRLVMRFKNISKINLRNKLDEICISGLVVDPQIYLQNVDCFKSARQYESVQRRSGQTVYAKTHEFSSSCEDDSCV